MVWWCIQHSGAPDFQLSDPSHSHSRSGSGVHREQPLHTARNWQRAVASHGSQLAESSRFIRLALAESSRFIRLAFLQSRDQQRSSVDMS
jgi:hypothetical protein